MNPNPGESRGGFDIPEVFEGFQECLYGVFRLWSRESLRGSRASLRECTVCERRILGCCRCFDCIDILRGSWILGPDSFCCGRCRILCGPWTITAVLQRVLVIMGWQVSLGDLNFSLLDHWQSVPYLHGGSQVSLEVPRLLYDDVEELSGALSEFWTYSGGFSGSFMGFKLCHDRL